MFSALIRTTDGFVRRAVLGTSSVAMACLEKHAWAIDGARAASRSTRARAACLSELRGRQPTSEESSRVASRVIERSQRRVGSAPRYRAGPPNGQQKQRVCFASICDAHASDRAAESSVCIIRVETKRRAAARRTHQEEVPPPDRAAAVRRRRVACAPVQARTARSTSRQVGPHRFLATRAALTPRWQAARCATPPSSSSRCES